MGHQIVAAGASFNPMGLLDWLYYAVAWIIMQIHRGLSHVFSPDSGWNWGLTIVLLTVFVRLLLFPLFVKQIHAQRKMADLAPKVQELRKKYKNDKQRMNQEVMNLYKENGANPLGGCLPLVAQFPVFIALFTVLRAISDWTPGSGPPKYGLTRAVVESAQHAHIFGVTVASRFIASAQELATQGVNPVTAKVVIGITVLISGTTTYLTVRQSTRRNLTPATADNPMMQSQKMMAYVAPLFALTGLYWQFGLVMYWVTSNLWTLGQQHYIFSKYPAPGAAAATAGGGQGGGQGTGKAAAEGAGGRQVRGKPAARQPSAGRQPSGGRKPPAGGGQVGASGATDGQSRPGLGRLLKGRSAPEPEPAPAPAPKLVRHQPTRQSRSKRTGKR
ncbi:MAG: membrane protein insertase YidC [Micromonosporaceae bacterium]